MRLIKKYKNRRLYDTETSQYVNVEQLKNYVIKGIEFKIEDSETGNEITNTILLQILVEMEMGPNQFLSSSVLRQIICLANHPMHVSLKNMMEQLFQTLKPIDNTPYQNIVENWNQQMQDMVHAWENLYKSK